MVICHCRKKKVKGKEREGQVGEAPKGRSWSPHLAVGGAMDYSS